MARVRIKMKKMTGTVSEVADHPHDTHSLVMRSRKNPVAQREQRWAV